MDNVTQKSKELFILINTPNEDIFEMTAFEYARWLTLLEAIEVIEKGAAHLKVDLDKTQDWVQPIAIEKYIRERSGDILHDLMRDPDFEKELKCTSSVVNPLPLAA